MAATATVSTDISEAVAAGRCILFLGAMASAPSAADAPYPYLHAPPGGNELARRLAKACKYPSNDTTNLQRVSLYAEFGPEGSRQKLVSAVETAIESCGYCTENIQIKPSPALQMLAALPFRIVITTNYDNLFDRALMNAETMSGRTKSPIIRIYDPTRTTEPEIVPIDPTEEKPILLKLHGDIRNPNSIVITEEDYITFVQRMASPTLHPIHQFIRMRMRAWPFLFIGYSLKDYNLRLLFRTLQWGSDEKLPLSYSVDPSPDDLVVAVTGKERTVSFIQRNLWEFVPPLFESVRGRPYAQP